MSAQSVSARATYHKHAQICLNSAPITPDSIAQLDGAPGALHVGDSEISGAHAACACLDEPARYNYRAVRKIIFIMQVLALADRKGHHSDVDIA